jgi:hypothetical protein
MPVVWPYGNGGVVGKVTKTTGTAAGTNATTTSIPPSAGGGAQSKPPPIAGIPGLPPASSSSAGTGK